MQTRKLAWREIRNAQNFSFIFVLNLSLGLLGFLLLNSFNESLNQTLESRAKTLLAADISISARRDLTQEEGKLANRVLADKIAKHHHLISIYSMGSVEKDNNVNSRLMQIKGIGSGYPLYGKITLYPFGDVESNVQKDLETQQVIWISEELQYQFKIDIGDKIKLGKLEFKISNIIKDDTTASWQGVGLAPKVYVGRKYLLNTGLISFGSVAGHAHQYLLKQPTINQVENLRDDLYQTLTDPAISVSLPQNSSEQVGRVLNYLTDYLGLVALVALFLSGIGTAYLFQSFLFIRLKEIGILKSLGLTKSNIKKIYGLQVSILGILAVVCAVVLSFILIPFLKNILNQQIGMDLEISTSLYSIGTCFVVAILTGLFVCLPILNKVIQKSTSEILFGEHGIKIEWSLKDIYGFIPLISLFWILSIWQAHSLIVGSVFVISILASLGLFVLTLPKILKLLSKTISKENHLLSSPLNLGWGLAIRNLVRNSFATTMSFLALALGVMLLSLIGQLEQSLQTELLSSEVEKPSLFLFDIQQEQYQSLVEFSKKEEIPLIKPSPMIRARITEVNGKKYERIKEESTLRTREDERQNRFRNRGINLSYTLDLDESQTITEGVPFNGVYDETKQEFAQISLEKRYAQRMGLAIGDVVTFDILGVEVKGKVVNLRKVKWTSFNPNFFILFQPGVIEEAPKTYLAAVKKMPKEKQFIVQDKLVENFYNISILNVTQLVSKILEIFSMMAVAIKVMAILCIIVGMIVIFSITQHQTRKEATELTIQKVLGLKWKQQLVVINKTFISIVLIATLVGSLFSIGLGNLLSRLFFDGVWTVDWKYFVVIFVLVLILTTFTVTTASFGILRQKSRNFLS